MLRKSVSALLFASIIAVSLASFTQPAKAANYYYIWDSATPYIHVTGTPVLWDAEAEADKYGFTKLFTCGGFGVGYVEAWADYHLTLTAESSSTYVYLTYDAMGYYSDGGKITLQIIDTVTGQTVLDKTKNLPCSTTVTRDTIGGYIISTVVGRQYQVRVKPYILAISNPFGFGGLSTSDYYYLDRFINLVVFAFKDVYSLYISAGSGGTTSPSPGTYAYHNIESVTVSALPRPGFTFTYWVLDGAKKYGNPITVTMNSDHVLKAYFKEKYCPILFVWNGTDYDEEGLLNIHDPDGIDIVYNHTLITEPAWTKGRYELRLVEHQKTHSYIDQVKLYAMLEDGTEIELPLTYAWHSEHGNVLPQLLFSDEWKTDILGADLNNGTSQSIDLEFSALPPNLQAASFIFQIEGNNMIPK